MKIAGYEIEIQKDQIKVGCTTITLDEMRELVRKVENYKGDVESIHEVLNYVRSQRDGNNTSTIKECIELIRDLGHENFMGVRARGKYEKQGFYLGQNEKIVWQVVDEWGAQILIPIKQ